MLDGAVHGVLAEAPERALHSLAVGGHQRLDTLVSDGVPFCHLPVQEWRLRQNALAARELACGKASKTLAGRSSHLECGALAHLVVHECPTAPTVDCPQREASVGGRVNHRAVGIRPASIHRDGHISPRHRVSGASVRVATPNTRACALGMVMKECSMHAAACVV